MRECRSVGNGQRHRPGGPRSRIGRLRQSCVLEPGGGRLGVVDRLSSELPGFPPDARVLIVNCDDFGMHDAVNAAVVESIEDGIASSCSLMVACPGFLVASGRGVVSDEGE